MLDTTFSMHTCIFDAVTARQDNAEAQLNNAIAIIATTALDGHVTTVGTVTPDMIKQYGMNMIADQQQHLQDPREEAHFFYKCTGERSFFVWFLVDMRFSQVKQWEMGYADIGPMLSDTSTMVNDLTGAMTWMFNHVKSMIDPVHQSLRVVNTRAMTEYHLFKLAAQNVTRTENTIFNANSGIEMLFNAGQTSGDDSNADTQQSTASEGQAAPEGSDGGDLIKDASEFLITTGIPAQDLAYLDGSLPAIKQAIYREPGPIGVSAHTDLRVKDADRVIGMSYLAAFDASVALADNWTQHLDYIDKIMSLKDPVYLKPLFDQKDTLKAMIVMAQDIRQLQGDEWIDRDVGHDAYLVYHHDQPGNNWVMWFLVNTRDCEIKNWNMAVEDVGKDMPLGDLRSLVENAGVAFTKQVEWMCQHSTVPYAKLRFSADLESEKFAMTADDVLYQAARRHFTVTQQPGSTMYDVSRIKPHSITTDPNPNQESNVTEIKKGVSSTYVRFFFNEAARGENAKGYIEEILDSVRIDKHANAVHYIDEQYIRNEMMEMVNNPLTDFYHYVVTHQEGDRRWYVWMMLGAQTCRIMNWNMGYLKSDAQEPVSFWDSGYPIQDDLAKSLKVILADLKEDHHQYKWLQYTSVSTQENGLSKDDELLLRAAMANGAVTIDPNDVQWGFKLAMTNDVAFNSVNVVQFTPKPLVLNDSMFKMGERVNKVYAVYPEDGSEPTYYWDTIEESAKNGDGYCVMMMHLKEMLDAKDKEIALLKSEGYFGKPSYYYGLNFTTISEIVNKLKSEAGEEVKKVAELKALMRDQRMTYPQEVAAAEQEEQQASNVISIGDHLPRESNATIPSGDDVVPVSSLGENRVVSLHKAAEANTLGRGMTSPYLWPIDESPFLPQAAATNKPYNVTISADQPPADQGLEGVKLKPTQPSLEQLQNVLTTVADTVSHCREALENNAPIKGRKLSEYLRDEEVPVEIRAMTALAATAQLMLGLGFELNDLFLSHCNSMLYVMRMSGAVDIKNQTVLNEVDRLFENVDPKDHLEYTLQLIRANPIVLGASEKPVV